MPELSLLRKLSYCRKFRIWFKHAQKGQKPITHEHTLNQRSPARNGIENRWPKGKAK